MAAGRWARVVLEGAYDSGSWVGETWQTGITLVDQDSGGVLAGAIRDQLPSFSATPDSEYEDGTTYAVDWAWTGQDKFTRADQSSLADACVAFYTTLKPYVPTVAKLHRIRITAFTLDGKAINGGNVFTLKSPVPGTGTSGTMLPPQNAVVLSLRSGGRGPGGRGRMYLPLNAGGTTEGKITAACQTAVLNGGAAFLEQLNFRTAMPAVVNRAKGTYSGYVTVACGNHFDTQRRRAQAVDEVYATKGVQY